jgi:TonB family protein
MRFHTASVLLFLTLGLVVFFVFIGTPAPAQQSSVAGRKLVNRVAPIYPELARKMQISGTVKVEAIVGANGKVKSTKVIGGSPLLAKAVLDAIEAWRWAATPSESEELIELTFRPQ